jgi:hypothetical protein
MNDRERMAWMMAALLLLLARPTPPCGDDELDQEWNDQLGRFMKACPTSSDFRREV